MSRLKDMHIVVTGAAGSIGTVVCRHLLSESARLTVSDLPQSRLADLAAELPDVCAIPADTSRLSAAQDLIGRAAASQGPIDGVVNVAGYWEIVDFLESDEEQWMRQLSANLFTAMATCRAALPAMVERRSGVIVNFASTAGEFGSIRPSAAYAAAKGGVIALTKSLAREVSPLGVRVNAISPGPIDTPMLKAASKGQRRVAAGRTLLGRLGTGEDIASGVCYLISSDSAFVTGDVLRVNGGSLI